MTSNDEYNNKCNKYIYKLQNTSINDSKFDLYLDKLNYWYGKMTGGAPPENDLISRLENSKQNLYKLKTKLNNFILELSKFEYQSQNGTITRKQFHPEDNYDNILDKKLMSLTLPIINIKSILKKKFEYTVYFYDKNKEITADIDTNIGIMTKTINDIQEYIRHFIIIQKDNMKGQINEVIEDIKTVIQNITTVIINIEIIIGKYKKENLINELKTCTTKKNNTADFICIYEYEKYNELLKNKKSNAEYIDAIQKIKEKTEYYNKIYEKFMKCDRLNNDSQNALQEFLDCFNTKNDCSKIYNTTMKKLDNIIKLQNCLSKAITEKQKKNCKIYYDREMCILNATSDIQKDECYKKYKPETNIFLLMD
jgi:hypothetical protein